ncbi:sigma-70 family RNA polymerase sigma factor [Photobacterium leiognathi]|uniref:sigma-70 family RNA polymerase sigma factor n=1 Tax=Photobacterium leiognathi TaxID=553611 RepID=UPI002980B6BD|nr:sigma-70 family RNA polymerase sigma factor [Photobacterium leiognathi]
MNKDDIFDKEILDNETEFDNALDQDPMNTPLDSTAASAYMAELNCDEMIMTPDEQLELLWVIRRQRNKAISHLLMCPKYLKLLHLKFEDNKVRKCNNPVLSAFKGDYEENNESKKKKKSENKIRRKILENKMRMIPEISKTRSLSPQNKENNRKNMFLALRCFACNLDSTFINEIYISFRKDWTELRDLKNNLAKLIDKHLCKKDSISFRANFTANYQDSHWINNFLNNLDHKQREESERILRKINTKTQELGIPLSELNIIQKNAIPSFEKAKNAANRIVKANLRLVIWHIRRKGKNSPLDFLDLVQEGNIGVIKAANKFDPRMNCRFSTYALWWIKQSFNRAYSDQSRIIKIPVHMQELLYKINRSTKEFMRKNDCEPTSEFLAEELGESIKKINQARKIIKEPVSLDGHMSQNDDDEKPNSMTEFLRLPEETSNPQTLVDNAIYKKVVLEAMNETLSQKEREILCLRFGIMTSDAHTLQEVGQMNDVTRERVRQIETQAKHKIKRYLSNKGIRNPFE